MQYQNQQEQPLFSTESFKVLQAKLSLLNQKQQDQQLLLDSPYEFKPQTDSSKIQISQRPAINQTDLNEEFLLKDIEQRLENTLQRKIIEIATPMNNLVNQPITHVSAEVIPYTQDSQEKRQVSQEQLNSIDKLSSMLQLHIANLSQIQTISESKVIIDQKYISHDQPNHQQLLLSADNKPMLQNTDNLLLSSNGPVEKQYKIQVNQYCQDNDPLIEIATQAPHSSEDNSIVGKSFIQGRQNGNCSVFPTIYQQTSSPLIEQSMIVQISSNKRSAKIESQKRKYSTFPHKVYIEPLSSLAQENSLDQYPHKKYSEPMDIEQTNPMVKEQTTMPMDIESCNFQQMERCYQQNYNQENNMSLQMNVNEDSKSNGPGDFQNQAFDKSRMILEQIAEKQGSQLQFILDNQGQNLNQEDKQIPDFENRSLMDVINMEEIKSESAKKSSIPTIDQSQQLQTGQITNEAHSQQNNQQIQQNQSSGLRFFSHNGQKSQQILLNMNGLISENQKHQEIDLQNINIDTQNELFMMEFHNNMKIYDPIPNLNENIKESKEKINWRNNISKEDFSHQNLKKKQHHQQKVSQIADLVESETKIQKNINNSQKQSNHQIQNNEQEIAVDDSMTLIAQQNFKKESKNKEFLQEIIQSFDLAQKKQLQFKFKQSQNSSSLKSNLRSSPSTLKNSRVNDTQTISFPQNYSNKEINQPLNAVTNCLKHQNFSQRKQQNYSIQNQIYQNHKRTPKNPNLQIMSPERVEVHQRINSKEYFRPQCRDQSTQFSPKITETVTQKRNIFEANRHSNIIIFNQQTSKNWGQTEQFYCEPRIENIETTSKPIQPRISININKFNQISLNIFNNALTNQKAVQNIKNYHETNEEQTNVIQNLHLRKVVSEQQNNIKNDPSMNFQDKSKQVPKIVNVFNQTIILKQNTSPTTSIEQSRASSLQQIENKSDSLLQISQDQPNQETVSQKYSKICKIADKYLLLGNLAQESDHVQLQKALETHVMIRITPEPISAVGRQIFKNGLLLIAMAKMIARSSKTPFLMNHIFQYFTGTFDIEYNSYTFQQEYNKIKEQFYIYLENQYIQKFNSNRLKQQLLKKQTPIIRTNLQLQELKDKNQKVQQNKLVPKQTHIKQLGMQSNFFSLNQQIKSDRNKMKILQNSQTQMTPKKNQPQLKLVKSSELAKVNPTSKIQKIQPSKQNKADISNSKNISEQKKNKQSTQQTMQSPPQQDKNQTSASVQILESMQSKKADKKNQKHHKKRQTQSKNQSKHSGVSKQKNAQKISNVSEQQVSNQKAQQSATKGFQLNQYIDLYDRYKRIRQNKKYEIKSPINNQGQNLFKPSIIESKDHHIEKKEKRVQFAQEPIIVAAKQENSSEETENMIDRVKKRKRSKRNNNNDSSLQQDNRRI